MNGGGISGSWNFRSSWSAVVDISAENTSSAPPANNSLTLVSYLAGARYKLPQPWLEGNHKPQPFAQIILGAAHAGGGEAGVADGSYKFATRIGGGIDVPLSAPFRGACNSDRLLPHHFCQCHQRPSKQSLGGRWHRLPLVAPKIATARESSKIVCLSWPNQGLHSRSETEQPAHPATRSHIEIECLVTSGRAKMPARRCSYQTSDLSDSSSRCSGPKYKRRDR